MPGTCGTIRARARTTDRVTHGKLQVLTAVQT
jgi:hypothetical protein